MAVPAPVALLTVTVKPIGSPALTEAASAVLVTDTLGHFTTMEAEAGATAPLLEAEAEAVLFTVPQVAAVVGLIMWTLKLAPAASDALVQVSTPAEMLQFGVPVVLAIDQLVPAFVGSVSVIETLAAVPVPGALLLLTVMVKPI